MGKKRGKHHQARGSLPDAAGLSGTANQPARSSLADFEAWMRKAGVTWDESVIQLWTCGTAPSTGDAEELSQCPHKQQPADAPWAVFAVSDVPEGRVLATIPRSTVLSAANCGLADVLAAERLGGGLALVAGVMYEAARGPKSKWHGYLSSLPLREYLPVFWSEEQLEALKGTDIGEKARADREAMAADFQSELAPLLECYPARLGPLAHGWNLEAFMRSASWVASRAFHVDEHHGDALVPLADVFNHKAARVDLGGGSGWAEGFVVAEHADAAGRHEKQRHRRVRKGKAAAGGGEQFSSSESDDEDEDVDEQGEAEEEVEAEDGSSDEEAAEGSGDSDGAEEEEEEEQASELVADEGEENEKEGVRGKEGRRRQDVRGNGRGSGGRGDGRKAALNRDPGDDGDDPWPAPPPPLPTRGQHAAAADTSVTAACATESAAGAECGHGGHAAGRSGGGDDGSRVQVPRRWVSLAEAAGRRGGRNLHLDIGICAVERGGCEVLDIVAAQPLTSGAEVYNTYGEHGNAELVNKYGFALPYNPFDELSVDKAALMAAVEARLGAKAARKRARFLEQHSDLLAEDEEPFFLLPPVHMNTALYVTLRVMAADDKQLAAWKSLEDAIQPLRAAWQRERQHQQRRQEQGSDKDKGCSTKRHREVVSEEPEKEESRKGKQSRSAKRAKGAGNPTDAGDAAGDTAKGQAGGGGGGFGGGRAIPVAADEAEVSDDEPANENDGERVPGDGEDGDDENELPEDVEIQGPSVDGAAAMEYPKVKGKGKRSSARDDCVGSKASRKGASAVEAGQGDSGGGGGGGKEGGGGNSDCMDAPTAQLWTDAMRSLLRAVVTERLAAYPTTLEQDEQLLEGRPQERVTAGAGAGGSGGMVACSPAEAEAAWSCSLLLRMGEKRLLKDVLARLAS